MDINIIDGNRQEAKHLREICFRFLTRENVEGDARELPSETWDAETSGKAELIGVFLMEVTGKFQDLVRKIRGANQLNYIVLLGDNLNRLAAAVNPVTRPSGCLLRPVETDKVDELLADILEDYKHIAGTEASVSFQIQGTLYHVSCERILFVESSNKKIRIRTENQQFEFYGSLERIQEQLPGFFMRVHKSYIVNLREIETVHFSEMTIYLRGGVFVFVSRTYKDKLRQYLESGEEK